MLHAAKDTGKKYIQIDENSQIYVSVYTLSFTSGERAAVPLSASGWRAAIMQVHNAVIV